MRKFVAIMVLSFIMMFSLVGCRKVVSVETQEVEVSIVDEYYRGSYFSPVFNGKFTTMINHPAIYRITVEYEGVEFVLSGKDIYNKYSNQVGETTMGTLEIKTYDDGSTKWDIIELN